MKELDDLIAGLENAKRELAEVLNRRRKEWDEIPGDQQLQMFEAERSELDQRLAELSEQREELDRQRAELDKKVTELQRYQRGPAKKAEVANQHIAEISKLIDEKQSTNPRMNDATARKSANKEYGKRHKKDGPYFKDDEYLTKKLKQFRSS